LGHVGPSNATSIYVQVANDKDATTMRDLSNDEEMIKCMLSMGNFKELNKIQIFFRDMMENTKMSSSNKEQEQWSSAKQQRPKFLRHFANIKHISKSLYGHLIQR